MQWYLGGDYEGELRTLTAGVYGFPNLLFLRLDGRRVGEKAMHLFQRRDVI
jgi:hypothetical protein